MKIAIIVRNFTGKSGQGVDRVTYNLVKNLEKVKGLNVKVVASKHPITSTLNGFFYDFSLIFKILKIKADIYQAMIPYTGSAPILTRRKRTVAVIHDVIPLKSKGMRPLSRLYYRFCTNICKKASRVVTVSEFSKREIADTLHIKKEKIVVIYNGIDHNVFYPKERKKEREFKIGFVGALVKQKNAFGVVRAFAKLKNRTHVKLLIGGVGREEKKIREFIRKHKVKNVQIVGFIPEDKLNDFYNSLDLFVFPSFYEGFGLPVLEALACGVPVITSNTSSLPEIAGEAGILVNPNSVDEIVNAMERVIKNKKLQNKMRVNGIKQAKKFDWEKTARETLKVYESLI
jgi:glycosyltransferase involved in cell wall biosynthesis